MRFVSKSLLILLIVLACSGCSTGSDVGLGVMHFEDTFSQRLNFYNVPDTLAEPVFYVDIIYEDSVKRVSTSLKAGRDTLAFYPLYLRSGGSLLSLQVIEKKGDWYKVYTDDGSKVMHWVYVKGKVLESWREFWPTVRTVKSASRTNLLRKSPSDQAQAYNFNFQRLCLKVMHVDGAWLKVQNTPALCENPAGIQREFEGFLRWKKEGEILIYFVL